MTKSELIDSEQYQAAISFFSKQKCDNCNSKVNFSSIVDEIEEALQDSETVEEYSLALEKIEYEEECGSCHFYKYLEDEIDEVTEKLVTLSELVLENE